MYFFPFFRTLYQIFIKFFGGKVCTFHVIPFFHSNLFYCKNRQCFLLHPNFIHNRLISHESGGSRYGFESYCVGAQSTSFLQRNSRMGDNVLWCIVICLSTPLNLICTQHKMYYEANIIVIHILLFIQSWSVCTQQSSQLSHQNCLNQPTYHCRHRPWLSVAPHSLPLLGWEGREGRKHS